MAQHIQRIREKIKTSSSFVVNVSAIPLDDVGTLTDELEQLFLASYSNGKGTFFGFQALKASLGRVCH